MVAGVGGVEAACVWNRPVPAVKGGSARAASGLGRDLMCKRSRKSCVRA